MTRIPAKRLVRTGRIRTLWRTPDSLREQTASTAYLTSPDPTLDIMPGDRIQALPDDGRRWEVSGYPSRDQNAFTSWRPTIEIPLSEYRG